MISVQYLATSLIVILLPGPGVLYTLTTGFVHGRKAGVLAAAGCTAGILPHLLATILGLAAVMHQSALAFQVLRYAGALYLLYLAYATWRDKSAFAVDSDAPQLSGTSIMVRAVLTNILNPKLTLFFLAFLPQFVDPHAGPALEQMLVLSGVFMAMTFAVFVVYGVLAQQVRARIAGSARVQAWLRRGFAATFAALGARLALPDR